MKNFFYGCGKYLVAIMLLSVFFFVGLVKPLYASDNAIPNDILKLKITKLSAKDPKVLTPDLTKTTTKTTK